MPITHAHLLKKKTRNNPLSLVVLTKFSYVVLCLFASFLFPWQKFLFAIWSSPLRNITLKKRVDHVSSWYRVNIKLTEEILNGVRNSLVKYGTIWNFGTLFVSFLCLVLVESKAPRVFLVFFLQQPETTFEQCSFDFPITRRHGVACNFLLRSLHVLTLHYAFVQRRW